MPAHGEVNTGVVDTLDQLNRRIEACQKCQRLRAWCKQVASDKRKSFARDEYWGRPVPNFGDPGATGLIVGLAPAAHGANRTGRMFTGDRSGEWLYRALFRAGLANQPSFERSDDGLVLSKVMITAVAHCAPPDNKPTKTEIENCSPFLEQAVRSKEWKAFLCLGGVAWTELHRCLGEKPSKFSHGAIRALPTGQTIVASYHPSQQNTFTGRLTQEMFDSAVTAFARLLD